MFVISSSRIQSGQHGRHEANYKCSSPRFGKSYPSQNFCWSAQTHLPAATKKKVDEFFSILEAIGEKAKTEKPSEIIKFIIKATGIETSLKQASLKKISSAWKILKNW
jgi:hypothetical protein